MGLFREARLAVFFSGVLLVCFQGFGSVLLEFEFEDGRDEEEIELSGEPFLGEVKQMESSHSSFEEAEEQLDLPPIGIQEDDVEGGKVGSVGEDQEGGIATLKGNQSVGGVGGIIGTLDPLIGQVGEEVAHRRRDGDGPSREDGVAQVFSDSYDEEGVQSGEVFQEIEGEVASIQDVSDACLCHFQEDFLFVGFPLGEEEVDRDHAVQLEGKMELDGMDLFFPLCPVHGGQRGEEGAIHTTEQSQLVHLRDPHQRDGVEEGFEEALKDVGGEACEGIGEGRFGSFGETQFRGSTLHPVFDAPQAEMAFEDSIDDHGDEAGERHLLFEVFG